MREVVIFSVRKRWLFWEVDLEKLNDQIADVEKDGWAVISAQGNVDLFGNIASFTLLIEHS